MGVMLMIIMAVTGAPERLDVRYPTMAACEDARDAVYEAFPGIGSGQLFVVCYEIPGETV